MADTIEHQGIVESISGSHLTVRIVQTSACSACSVRGHCASAESKEKIIDIIDPTGQYNVGDPVMVVGEISMGLWAVLLAFVIPFAWLVASLFLLMAWLGDELRAALLALALLAPYYYIVWLCRNRLKKKFSFSIKPVPSH